MANFSFDISQFLNFDSSQMAASAANSQIIMGVTPYAVDAAKASASASAAMSEMQTAMSYSAIADLFGIERPSEENQKTYEDFVLEISDALDTLRASRK